MTLQEEVDPLYLEALDLEEIYEEDRINDRDKSQPYRYGISRPVVISIHHDGVWSSLENGGKIWRAAITSPGAKNLSAVLSKFHLPKGATLHFYNTEHTDRTITFSKLQNRDNDKLATWFVAGETLWVEYYEPANVDAPVQLEIESVVHGYRMDALESIADMNRGLNDSGDCNYDVNCPIGDDFDSQKDILKKAVAMLTLGNGYLCSAVLLNNTNADKTPFLLTANHCLENSDPSLWTIRFNWMSPNPVCATGDESADLLTNFTMSGATLRSSNSESDFALVELHSQVPDSWDIVFAGWDNSDLDPLFEVGIHHPNGDIMKICRDDSGAVKEDANGTQVWLIGGVSVGEGDGWEIGTTESGSSGSPLFNENGKVIGQLYAGQSHCDGLESNSDYDIYGRLGVSWDFGDTPETRLKDWLDPLNIGVSELGSLQNILNIPEVSIEGSLEIYPNPVSNTLLVMNNRYPNLTYQFYNILGQELHAGSMANTINTLSVVDLAEGVYFLHLIDGDTDSRITKKILVDR
ncbi:hypothetical protein ULVI_13355 [Cochleicola gelatinilyticus]|uniref:Uncharacterized protein n=1 Tax=Cochleicola gelatinilyticus TaxID=1763537 RepID=A0A167EZR0_9FLAO|nr:hypothetical protein ULVI_13355 [Cochleicola gelatinilyticus]